MARKKFYCSPIVFKAEPVADGGPLLGFIMGFKAGQSWVLAMAMRKRIDAAFLNALDPLSREVVENREKILTAEINEVWDRHTTPAKALEEVAARNCWALCVRPPRGSMVEISERPSDAILDNISALKKEFAVAFWSRLAPGAKAQPAPIRHIRHVASAHSAVPTETPPAWVLHQLVWVRPALGD
jgi:hypothetical protein